MWRFQNVLTVLANLRRQMDEFNTLGNGQISSILRPLIVRRGSSMPTQGKIIGDKFLTPKDVNKLPWPN